MMQLLPLLAKMYGYWTVPLPASATRNRQDIPGALGPQGTNP